jgi:hypothetical protein
MKISVLGLWRDSSETSHRTLQNLQNIVDENQDIQFNFFFYENDSKDNTKEILDNWITNFEGKVFSENYNLPKFGSVVDITRLVLLSFYRNRLKELCFDSLDSEYTLLIDTDIIFDSSHLRSLLQNIKELNAAMVVANTRQNAFPDLMLKETNDTFYDAFALRDRFNNSSIYFTNCPLTINKDRNDWNQNIPIQLISGFSGFALLKTDIFKECKWSTTGHSEHVNFCYEINKYGLIYIIPSCKPLTEISIKDLDFTQITQNAVSQIEKIKNINEVYETSISSKIVVN